MWIVVLLGTALLQTSMVLAQSQRNPYYSLILGQPQSRLLENPEATFVPFSSWGLKDSQQLCVVTSGGEIKRRSELEIENLDCDWSLDSTGTILDLAPPCALARPGHWALALLLR